MNQVTKLRGHHIDSFVSYIYWVEIKGKWDPFHTQKYLKYGDNFIENERELYEMLYHNSSCEVMIIENDLDDICTACKIRSPNCINKSSKYDDLYARDFGFKVGEIYQSRDFINYVREHYKHMLEDRPVSA